jgi:hypothetical protein
MGYDVKYAMKTPVFETPFVGGRNVASLYTRPFDRQTISHTNFDLVAVSDLAEFDVYDCLPDP